MDLRFRIDSVPLETSQAACSIAKVTRLIGPLTRSEDAKFKEEFDLAELVAELGIRPTRSLEEELEVFGVEEGCVAFIRWLLTLDPAVQPAAEEALEHPWVSEVVGR